MTILNTGHVGIGTKSPQGKLEVSAGWLEMSNSGDTVRSAISASNGNYLSIEAFNIDNSAKLPVNLNPWGGSVGIGTTSPIGNIGLHLKASKWDYTTAGGMVIQAADSGVDPGIMFFNADGKERGAIGQALAGGRWSQDAMAGDVVLRSAQGRLIFSTDNVNFPPYTPSPSYPAQMVIDNNGNVGIGTTSPSHKLEVIGGEIYASSAGHAITGQTTDPNYAGVHGVNYVGGRGVAGAATSGGTGVSGTSDTGTGIYGSGLNGVVGDGQSAGVWGRGNNYGVYGFSGASWGIFCDGASCGGTKAWSLSSDERLKKNITTIDNALEKVEKLRGVSFEWKNDSYKGKNIGFIAQELEKVVPEVVSHGPDGYYTAKSSELTALLVEAIKEQQKQIENLTIQNAEQQQEIDRLKEDINILQSKN